MAKSFATFVAIVDRTAAAALLRDRVRDLHFAHSDAHRPAPGDRIAILATGGPSFVSAAEFVATALVRTVTGGDLTLRHRVLAPTAHRVALSSLPTLRVAAGWTHERLGALRGSAVRCTAGDFERVEGALLEAARRFGPPARRPAHRRPRTPGRRALIAGRAAVGRRP
jgi:hypothetical protein